MESEYRDQDAQGADGQNQNSKPNQNSEKKENQIGLQSDEQAVTGGTSGNSPTNEQPSGSQNNQWQQDHKQGSIPNTGQQGVDQYENNSRPAQQFSSTEDDELEDEQGQPKDYRTEEFIEENHLERTDQDYRDGDNQSGEDQDEDDALRNGM